MNEYMRDSIVEHAWHQFLYGYNGEERTKFLQSMVDSHPIKFDSTDAAAVLISDYSLPIVDNPVKCDSYQMGSVAREHFSVVLVDAIVEQTIQQIDLDKLNDKMKSFIKAVNRLLLNPDFDRIRNIEEFSKVLKDVKKFYSDEYIRMLQTGSFQGDITSLRLGFIDLNFFASYFKRALNMNRHFSVIIDQRKVGAVVSQKAVNGIVTRRCTGDISMKIACEPRDWKTYYDLSGMLAEAVHDYSAVELDDCYAKYVKELRTKRMI
jgi:hypothetical protein